MTSEIESEICTRLHRTSEFAHSLLSVLGVSKPWHSDRCTCFGTSFCNSIDFMLRTHTIDQDLLKYINYLLFFLLSGKSFLVNSILY